MFSLKLDNSVRAFEAVVFFSGIGPLLQFSHLLRAGPILLKLLFFPLVLFILPSFAWVYIFFSTGQVLLSTFSWCSAFTSVSDGVFLRDVLHVYLLLHHLVLLHPHPCSNTTMCTWGHLPSFPPCYVLYPFSPPGVHCLHAESSSPKQPFPSAYLFHILPFSQITTQSSSKCFSWLS